MKKTRGRTMVCSAALLIAVSLGVLVWWGQESESPTIYVEQPDHDFGDLRQYETVEHTYRFVNTGGRDLKVTGSRASCACSVVRLPSKPIAAGQWGEVSIIFNTESRLGAISQWAIIETNDPEHPQVPLKFAARVIRELIVTPPAVFFGEVPYGKESSETVELIDGGARTLSVRDVRSTNSYMSCRMEQGVATNGARNYRVAVLLARDTPIGRHKCELRIRTTSIEQPEVIIPVVAQVVGNLRVSPCELALRATAEESYVRRVTIDSLRDDFRVECLVADPDRIRGHIKDVSSGNKRRYEAEIEVLPLAGEGKRAGTIVLKTNDPLQPVVEIPYSTGPLGRAGHPAMH